VTIWAWYSTGVLICILSKWAAYTKHHKAEAGAWAAAKKWFDLTFVEDKVSWATTLVVCYLLGLSYIDNITFGIFDVTGMLPSIPKHHAVACAVGFVAETLAPGLACKLLKLKDSWIERE